VGTGKAFGRCVPRSGNLFGRRCLNPVGTGKAFGSQSTRLSPPGSSARSQSRGDRESLWQLPGEACRLRCRVWRLNPVGTGKAFGSRSTMLILSTVSFSSQSRGDRESLWQRVPCRVRCSIGTTVSIPWGPGKPLAVRGRAPLLLSGGCVSIPWGPGKPLAGRRAFFPFGASRSRLNPVGTGKAFGSSSDSPPRLATAKRSQSRGDRESLWQLLSGQFCPDSLIRVSIPWGPGKPLAAGSSARRSSSASLSSQSRGDRESLWQHPYRLSPPSPYGQVSIPWGPGKPLAGDQFDPESLAPLYASQSRGDRESLWQYGLDCLDTQKFLASQSRGDRESLWQQRDVASRFKEVLRLNPVGTGKAFGSGWGPQWNAGAG